MCERCVKGRGRLKERSVQEEKRRKAVALRSDGNEEQEIKQNFFYNTRPHSSHSQRERVFFDFSATREAAGKKTNISVRFLYYFFNGLRLSKNASERDIAPFTPQRYNIPPTLSKHFPSLFPFFLPSPSASLLRPSASLFCQSISLFRQPAQ